MNLPKPHHQKQHDIPLGPAAFSEEQRPSRSNLPLQAATGFANLVKAGCLFLGWSLIGLASLAVTYVAVRGLWVGVKMVLSALGIVGG